jgi:hypothetical protein
MNPKFFAIMNCRYYSSHVPRGETIMFWVYSASFVAGFLYWRRDCSYSYLFQVMCTSVGLNPSFVVVVGFMSWWRKCIAAVHDGEGFWHCVDAWNTNWTERVISSNNKIVINGYIVCLTGLGWSSFRSSVCAACMGWEFFFPFFFFFSFCSLFCILYAKELLISEMSPCWCLSSKVHIRNFEHGQYSLEIVVGSSIYSYSYEIYMFIWIF